jgi:hypothetical protein
MATTEAGHASNRSYFDRDGILHLNGASIALDESGTSLSPTEASYLEGITPGTVAASKAVIADANGAVDTLTILTALVMSGKLRFKTSAVAAAGSGQANGGSLNTGFNQVTGADNTTCVVLPAPAAGEFVAVKNTVSGKNLPVYPSANVAIDASSVNAAVNQASLEIAIYIAHNTTQWYKLKGA